MTTKTSEEPKQKVRHPDNMSLEDFEMHMNMRHSDSLGGFGHLTLSKTSPYVVTCWRTFHRTIHRLRLHKGLDHEHGPYRAKKEVA